MTTLCRQQRTLIRGFTLVEVMLALVLASLVGVTILIMLQAVGSATEERFSMREPLVNRQVVSLRIGAVLRPSSMVLGADSERLVLWAGDANLDGVPNLSELRLVKYQPSAGQVWVYEASASLAPGSDTAYTLGHNFVATADALAGSAEFPGQVLLGQVSAWDVILDTPDPHAAHTVRTRVTCQTESGQDSTVVISSLRCSQ